MDDGEGLSVKYKEGILQRVYDNTIGWLLGAVYSVVLNGIFAGIPTIFSGIVWVVRIILMVLYYILFKVVPFLVQYVGIPMFILGALLGIMFLGGHMLFVVLFVLGMYFYVKGLLNIKLVSKAPKNNTNNTNTQMLQSTKPSTTNSGNGKSGNGQVNNEMKFK